MRFQVTISAVIEADSIDDAMVVMRRELDPDKEDTVMEADSVIDIHPLTPFPVPGQVFGFWLKGVWQPVLEGMTVKALPDGVVQFTYPVPQ